MTGPHHPQSASTANLLRVVNLLHEAFADAARWPTFLAELARLCSARHAVMMALEADPAHPVLASYGLSSVAAGQWHAYYRGIDPWLSVAQMPGPGGFLVIDGEALVADEALRRMPVFDAYLAPNDLRWLRGFWVHPDAARAMPYGVLLWRGVDQTSFDDSVLQTLDTVARAITAFEKVSVSNALSRAAGLDARDTAAFLLDAQGRLIMANGSGESLLQRRIVTDGDTGRISLGNDVADRWLASLIGSDTSDAARLDLPSRCRENLQGIGAASLEFSAMRPIGAAPALSHWRYALSIRPDAPARVGVVRRTAQRIYRWTNAEYDAVARLAAGEALPEIARQRASAVETVRSHLKNAKRKAGVHRQVDLVRIFTSLQANPPPGEEEREID